MSAKSQQFVVEISEAELTVMILDGFVGISRPPGVTAEEALAHVDQDIVAQARGAARKLAEYFIGEFVNRKKVQ